MNKLDILQKQIFDLDKKSFFIKDSNYLKLNSDDILKHNLFHIVKASSKIADYLEKKEHNENVEMEKNKIINEVVPDLFIYSIQLANSLNIKIDSVYENRIEFIANKYK